MLKSEAAKLLAYVSGADRRDINQLSVEVWHDLLGDVAFDDAITAVREHYRDAARPVYPADVISRVREFPGRWEPLPEVPEGVQEWLSKLKIAPEDYMERRSESGWVEAMEVRAREAS